MGGIEVRRINGRLVPRQENSTHYYVVSEDSILSKDTKIFGKSSKVIGRMCTVLDTVNASTIPSPEVLMEAFKLEFTGIIRLNETCPENGSSSSIIHEITSPATVTIPILCSVQSMEFSCESVTLWSGDTKSVHTSYKRMFISQDSAVEDAVEVNNDTFIGDNITLAASASLESLPWYNTITQAISTYQTPVIAGGVVIAAILLMALPAKLMMQKSGGASGVNVNNYNSVNTSSDSSKTVELDVEVPIRPNCPPLPQIIVAPYNMDAIGELKKEEMAAILKKEVHLRTPWEKKAAGKWVEQYESN